MAGSGWKDKFDFANFVKNLRILGLLQEARVSSFGLVNAIGIYRARVGSKKNEKRYPLQCKNIFSFNSNQIFSKFDFSFLA